MAGSAKQTRNHEEIRRWVEERGGWPAAVKSTERADDPGLLRIDFPGYSGEGKLDRISWDDFFSKFDERNLVFLYQDETGKGQPSRFNKLVSAESAEEKNSGSRSRSATRSRSGTGAGAGRSASGASRGTRSAPGSNRGTRSAAGSTRSSSSRSSTRKRVKSGTGSRSQSGTGTRKPATASRAGTTRRSSGSTSAARERSRASTSTSRVRSTTRSSTPGRPTATTPRAHGSGSGSTSRQPRTANAETEEVGSRSVTNTIPPAATDHVHPVVVGVFADRAQADCAEKELKRAGFKENQIGVAMRGERNGNTQTGVIEQGNKAGEGAAKGLVTGGVIGGLLGAAAAMLLPGIGPVLAGGILATSIAGAATGAVAGGILGSLVGLGIPEEEARYYEQQFEAGRIIMTARANGRHDEAERVLRSCGSYDVHNQHAGTDEQIRLAPHGDEAETEEPHTATVTRRTRTNRETGHRA